MLLTLAAVVAIPLGVAAFLLYDRWAYRDNTARPEDGQEEPRITSLNLSGPGPNRKASSTSAGR
jgi:hypothetical protein